MQVSVETTGGLERRMDIQVPAERIAQEVEARLKTMSRTVRLKGFRPGKVPVNVVRQQFGPQVRVEVLDKLVQSTFAEAVAQEKLNPATGPRIEPLDMKDGADLKFRATFEVFPEVELKGLDFSIDKPVAEVTDQDIDTMVENLRKQRPIFAAVDRESRDTDRVTVDFEGKLDGETFEGGKGENVQIVLGAGRMLKDFEAGALGARANEQKTIDVTFPADYPAANLAGKTAQFALNVKSVEEQTLPEVSDEFLKAFGIEEGGLERLREEIGDNMRRELTDTIRNSVKKQVMDQLLAANPIDVPKALLESEIRNLQMEAARRSGARDASQLPPAEQFTDVARRRIALGILVREIITKQNIQTDRARLQAKFHELASQYPSPQDVLKAYQSNPQAQEQVESLVLEDQVVEKLLEGAKVNEKASSFKELMNFGA